MPASQAPDVLRQTYLLRDLGEPDLLRVSETLRREEYAPGQEILQQGGPPDALYFLQHGQIELVRREPSGRERRLGRLLPGDVFGELELVHRQSRFATARALSPAVVLRWDRRSVASFARAHPGVLAALRFSAASRQKAFRLRLPWLEEDEPVYALARKHPIVLYRALILPAILEGLGAILLAWWLSGATDLAAWGSVAAALAGILLGLWRGVDWANDYYIVTDRRAVWLEKVIGLYDSRQEAPLRMVLSVSTGTEILGRLLDFGDVVIRTYTGQVTFHSVPQPKAMAALIEEHWRRAQEHDQRADHETIVESLHERFGQSTPAPEVAGPAPPSPSPQRPPSDTGLDRWNFLLRFEEKGIITYRKHWAVLVRATILPAVLVLTLVGLTGARVGGLFETLAVADFALLAGALLVPLGLWWMYQYADWANDIYQVTPDQIVDVHKKPLAREERKVAPLENILGTEVDRRGIFRLLLNYGDVIANVGTTEFVFQGVYDPSGVQQDLVRAQEAFLERKRLSERGRRREEMVEWLDAYHHEIASRRTGKDRETSGDHGHS